MNQVTDGPLVGRPLVCRTWAVWPAASTRRDIAGVIASLETVASV